MRRFISLEALLRTAPWQLQSLRTCTHVPVLTSPTPPRTAPERTRFLPPAAASLVNFTELSANRLSLLELTLQTTFPEWLCQAPWSSFCLSAIDAPLLHQPSAEMVLCCFSSGKCSSRNTASRQRETINPRTEWTFRDAKRVFKNMSLGKAGSINHTNVWKSEKA